MVVVVVMVVFVVVIVVVVVVVMVVLVVSVIIAGFIHVKLRSSFPINIVMRRCLAGAWGACGRGRPAAGATEQPCSD
ncbi:hypothetical protein E2C01_094304 [Portunus trituberculatus]|uniref:Uncharacterized protein n=1 Tax=Portunus trituberculatus TaxID=210409 RepID=A0A5B7K0F6_PORTR|nr:hypothetical protein [Portunus trituberculatus]